MTRTNTAAAEYQALAKQVAEQLERIQRGLARHAQEQAGKPTSYGFVGDMEGYLHTLKDMADNMHKTGEYAA